MFEVKKTKVVQTMKYILDGSFRHRFRETFFFWAQNWQRSGLSHILSTAPLCVLSCSLLCFHVTSDLPCDLNLQLDLHQSNQTPQLFLLLVYFINCKICKTENTKKHPAKSENKPQQVSVRQTNKTYTQIKLAALCSFCLHKH